MLRTKRFTWTILVFSILLMTSSCFDASYRQSLRSWTKKGNVYDANTLDAQIMWRATYLSPEFQSAAEGQIGTWMKMEKPDKTARYLTGEGTGGFLVSVYTMKGYPAINENQDDFWDFDLVLPSGESYPPYSIESVTITPREKRLFPYLNKWSKFYLVKFPVMPLERPFALCLRSANVTSQLKWK